MGNGQGLAKLIIRSSGFIVDNTDSRERSSADGTGFALGRTYVPRVVALLFPFVEMFPSSEVERLPRSAIVKLLRWPFRLKLCLPS